MKISCLRETPDGVYLAVKLQPRASRNSILGLHGAELKISVTAPPVDSAANAALLDFLAQSLEVRPAQLQLVRGHTSRHKTILVSGLPPATIIRSLRLA